MVNFLIGAGEKILIDNGRRAFRNRNCSGSKDGPIETLANAGIDMNSPLVVEECVKEFEAIVDEMETLMRAEGLITKEGAR